MPDAAVVAAARAGDRPALERLAQSYLPLAYNILGRASDGCHNIDDAVAQVMLRALDDLPELASPEQFRSSLLAIAVERIHTAGWAQSLRAATSGALEEQVDFVDLTIRQLELTGQRREAVEATRWLGEEREVLALWWLEAAGMLARPEWAEACGLSGPQAAARVGQVEERLEAARSVVRALAASPRCAELTALVVHWDGLPSGRSGKRLGRHVLDCSRCRLSTTDLVPADRLLRGFALVTPPPELTGRLLVTGALPTTAEPGKGLALVAVRPDRPVGGRLRRLVTAPVLGMAVAVAVLAGSAVVYSFLRPERQIPPTAVRIVSGASSMPATRPLSGSPTAVPATPTKPVVASTDPRRPSAASQRTAPAQAVPARPSGGTAPVAAAPFLGRHALRSVAYPDRYVREVSDLSYLAQVGTESPTGAKQEATFTIEPGVADASCYSFVDSYGRYLRHFQFRVRLDFDDGSPIFKQDVTFCVRSGTVSGSFFLQSYNYPDRFFHFRDNFELWLDPIEYSSAFLRSASFTAVAPWA